LCGAFRITLRCRREIRGSSGVEGRAVRATAGAGGRARERSCWPTGSGARGGSRADVGPQRAPRASTGGAPRCQMNRGAITSVIVLSNLISTCRLGPAVSLRSEEHTSELQSLAYLVCRLL